MAKNFKAIESKKDFIIESIKILKSHKFLLIIFCFISIATTTFFCAIQDPVYTASTKISILPRVRSLNVTQFVKYSPLFLKHFYYNQYIIMHSRNIIIQVIKDLDLRRRMSPYKNFILPEDVTISWLIAALRINFFEEVNIMEITFSMKDRFLATEIANQYVEVYKNQRFEEKKRRIGQTLDELQVKLNEAKIKLEKSEDTLDKIKRDKNLIYFRGNNIDKDKLLIFNKDYLDMQIERITREIELNKLHQLTDEESKANLLLLDEKYINLIKLKKQNAEEEINLAYLQSSFGPKYPDLLESKRKLEMINKNINSEIHGLITGLEIQYDVIKEKEKSLEKILNEEKDKIKDQESIEINYAQAEREMLLNQEIYIMLKKEYIKQISIYDLPERTVEIISKATPPLEDDYVSPNYIKNLSISAFSSFFIGIIFILIYGFFEVYFYNQARARAYSVLSVIPTEVEGIVSGKEHNNPQYEAFKVLATDIIHRKNIYKSILITSGCAGEGKTTVLANLAVTLGSMNKRILVVDANLKKPDLNDFLGIQEPELGLKDIDRFKDNFKQMIVPMVYPNVDLLPAGIYDNNYTGGIIDFANIRLLVQTSKPFYDFILFDSPPVIGFSDSILLANIVDGVIIVEGYKMYPNESPGFIEDHLKLSGAKVIGTVLNNVVISDKTYKPYYQVMEYK